jgi:hypothetical protein
MGNRTPRSKYCDVKRHPSSILIGVGVHAESPGTPRFFEGTGAGEGFESTPIHTASESAGRD